MAGEKMTYAQAGLLAAQHIHFCCVSQRCSATRAAARYLLNFGYKVYGVQNGFEGFETGLLSELDWMQVSAWVCLCRANVATCRAGFSAEP
jgi:hypothetical protein